MTIAKEAKIEVYLTSLQQPQEIRSECFAALSESEQLRASARQNPEKPWQFIVGRGTMRLLLARSLDDDPAKLDIRRSSHGKPYLFDSTLYFNLSHSEDLVACALSADAAIGVDVERERELSPRAEGLLLRASGMSRNEFDCLSAQQRSRSLIEWWTRREAFGKALGTGIMDGMRSYEAATGEKQARLANGFEPPTNSWTVRGFNPGNNYCGAVAARAQALSIRLEWVNWIKLLS